MKGIYGYPRVKIWLEKTYGFHISSEDQVKKTVADYIEFYNTDRFQSKLNNLSPVEFRTKAA